jgi:hypothetical protein
VHSTWLVPELIVQAPSNGTTKSERQGHARQADTDRRSPVAQQIAYVNLESDQEQEENKSKISDEVEIRYRSSREDGIREARNAAHHRWAQQDTSNNFCDNARLSDARERPVEKSTEYDDDAGLESLSEPTKGLAGLDWQSEMSYLDDEQDDRIFRVVHRWVFAFEDAALRSRAHCARSTRGARGSGDHAGDHLRYSRHSSGLLVVFLPYRLDIGGSQPLSMLVRWRWMSERFIATKNSTVVKQRTKDVL